VLSLRPGGGGNTYRYTGNATVDGEDFATAAVPSMFNTHYATLEWILTHRIVRDCQVADWQQANLFYVPYPTASIFMGTRMGRHKVRAAGCRRFAGALSSVVDPTICAIGAMGVVGLGRAWPAARAHSTRQRCPLLTGSAWLPGGEGGRARVPLPTCRRRRRRWAHSPGRRAMDAETEPPRAAARCGAAQKSVSDHYYQSVKKMLASHPAWQRCNGCDHLLP